MRLGPFAVIRLKGTFWHCSYRNGSAQYEGATLLKGLNFQYTPSVSPRIT